MLFVRFSELSIFGKNAALKFVAKYEPLCVQFVAYLRKSEKNVYVAFFNSVSPDQIFGLFSLNKTVLHCLPLISNSCDLQNDFVNSLVALLQNETFSVKGINGTESGTLLILQAFEKIGQKPFQVNNYNLLKLDLKEFSKIRATPLKNGEKIIRFKKNLPESYRDALQELQNAYEQEEVLQKGATFDEHSCRLRLSNAIRSQCILALELPSNKYDNSEKKSVLLASKASTNSIGIRCAQIGGVYTSPDFRGQHYAFNTVLALLQKILRMRKLPVLFVKKSNEQACALYKNLAFIKIADYLIAYF